MIIIGAFCGQKIFAVFAFEQTETFCEEQLHSVHSAEFSSDKTFKIHRVEPRAVQLPKNVKTILLLTRPIICDIIISDAGQRVRGVPPLVQAPGALSFFAEKIYRE